MTAPLSVLHVISAGEVGGAERMLVDLARRGPERHLRHAVALFTPAAPAGPLRHFFRDAGLEVHDAGAASESPVALVRRTLGTAALRFVVDTGRRVGASLVHVHTFASQALGTRAAEALGVPLVRTEHSTRVYDDPSCWPFARYSLQHAAAVVAISEHIAAVVRRRAPFVADEEGRLQVIPSGIDPARFRYVEPPLPDPEGRLRLVAVGRLDRRKGFDQAIDAVAQVAGVHLDLVGDGEERGALEERIVRAGVTRRVVLRGWISEPAAAIARADAALCSSRTEGLGLSLLEAMSVGRPVLALPVGGVVDFVRDGQTGFLASGEGVSSLAALLRRAKEHRAALHELGRGAHDLVASLYTADVMADAYAGLYRRLAC